MMRDTLLTFKPNFRETDDFVESPYMDNRLGVWNALKVAETLENGAIVYIADGTKKGMFGKVKDINNTTGMQPNTITLIHDKEEFMTKKTYAFVIGKTKSEIKLPQ